MGGPAGCQRSAGTQARFVLLAWSVPLELQQWAVLALRPVAAATAPAAYWSLRCLDQAIGCCAGHMARAGPSKRCHPGPARRRPTPRNGPSALTRICIRKLDLQRVSQHRCAIQRANCCLCLGHGAVADKAIAAERGTQRGGQRLLRVRDNAAALAVPDCWATLHCAGQCCQPGRSASNSHTPGAASYVLTPGCA